MNNVLYFLVGGCVAVVLASAFSAKTGFTNLDTTDIVVSLAFIALFAGGLWLLNRSSSNERWKLRARKMQAAKHEDIRRTGQLPTPPWWAFWLWF